MLQLIGMLDSPYVRRVAISLQYLGIPFQHKAVSVFNIAEFSKINPLIKVPSLICEDGEVLMESSLIIDYAERLSAKTLMPQALQDYQHHVRLVSLALVAFEKSIDIFLEPKLRPVEKTHQPWVDRLTMQLKAAYTALEQALEQQPAVDVTQPSQAVITMAVAWHFSQQTIPQLIAADDYPLLAQHSAVMEQQAAFKAAPHGLGTYVGPVV